MPCPPEMQADAGADLGFDSAGDLPRGLLSWFARFGLVLALVGLCLILAWKNPKFLEIQNLINVLRQISISGILAVGVTYVLLTGGVDLSLGSVVALAGVVAARCAQVPECPLAVAALMGVLAGLACGTVNGILITQGRVAPFIVTLGMMTAARGLALVISDGKPVSNLNKAFFLLGDDVPGLQIPTGHGVVGLPVPILILFVIALSSYVFLKNLRLGRYIYAVGGNEQAARASGLNVGGIKLFAYMLCGALAGLAGVVLASRVQTGTPNAAVGYELDAIAAVVIGGTSLSGGVGGVGGTILGALLMGVINTGLDLLNVKSYYQQIVKGVIIVAAVWLDRYRQK